MWNWNNLGDGTHTVLARIDGVPFAQSPVTVTTFGEDMLGDEEKAAFTQEFVQTALNRYDREGREATVAHYNNQASVEGEWYVFIIDEHDLFLSHAPTPALVGTHDGLIFGAGYYGPPNFQEYRLWDFPTEGLGPSLQWSQSLQNFVVTGLWYAVAVDRYADDVQEGR